MSTSTVDVQVKVSQSQTTLSLSAWRMGEPLPFRSNGFPGWRTRPLLSERTGGCLAKEKGSIGLNWMRT